MSHRKAFPHRAALLEAAFEQSVTGMCLSTLEGSFVAVNAALSTLLGYSTEEFLGGALPPFLEREGAGPGSALDFRLGNTPLARFERRYRHKDGHVIWTEVQVTQLEGPDGKPAAFLSQLQSIDPRKAMEAALRRGAQEIETSRRRFQSLFESMLDGFVLYEVVYDEGGKPRGLRSLELNAAFERITGYSRDSFLGSVVTEKTSLVKPSHLGLMMQVGRTRKNARFELFIEKLQKRVDVVAFSPEENQVALIITDITEKRREEIERSHLEAQLLHASKLATIGTLAAGMAHEINNPLTIIHGNIGILRESLEEGGLAGPEQMQLLDRQLNAVNRIAKIVDGLRSYARSDSEVLESVDLARVIADVVGLVEPVYRKSEIRIETELQEADLLVVGNHGKLQQVLMNLLSNARAALLARPTGRLIRLRAGRAGGVVLLTVVDNGSGIAAGNLARVFDPFFTTKAVGDGTGLGLFLVQSMLSSMGGRIEVESAENEGSAFVLELRSPSLQDALGSRNALVPIPRFKGRVLLVDDSTEIREGMRRQLESWGLRVSEARDGREGLDFLSHEDFDLAILDTQMPRMNGDEVLRELQAMPEPAVPVLQLRGRAAEPRWEEGQSARLGVLPKPCTARELAQAIARVLELR